MPRTDVYKYIPFNHVQIVRSCVHHQREWLRRERRSSDELCKHRSFLSSRIPFNLRLFKPWFNRNQSLFTSWLCPQLASKVSVFHQRSQYERMRRAHVQFSFDPCFVLFVTFIRPRCLLNASLYNPNHFAGISSKSRCRCKNNFSSSSLCCLSPRA